MAMRHPRCTHASLTSYHQPNAAAGTDYSPLPIDGRDKPEQRSYDEVFDFRPREAKAAAENSTRRAGRAAE